MLSSPVFTAVLDQMREHVGILDREGNLLWCNEVLARLLGIEPGDTGGMPAVRWLASVSSPSLMRSLIALETGMTPPGERISLALVLQARGGRRVDLVGSVLLLPGLAETNVLLIGRRPDRRRADPDGLLPSQVDFLANMSHELRTPLNAIIGYSELLSMKEFVGTDEQRRRYAADIQDSGRHLLSLIDDILEFAKAGAGRMTIRIEEVEVAEALNSCLSVAEGLAVHMGRPMQFDLATEGNLGFIRTDLRLFKQIVVNLLSNAVKFSPDGGRVELAARRAGLWLQVAVRDQGVGIATSEAERIFSAFYQVDGTARRQRGGMGLGLAIVRRFLNLLGGGIRLKSKPGVGTTFTFHIPVDARRVPRDAAGRPVSSASELPALDLSTFDDGV